MKLLKNLVSYKTVSWLEKGAPCMGSSYIEHGINISDASLIVIAPFLEHLLTCIETWIQKKNYA